MIENSPTAEYLIQPTVFHEIGLTLTQFLIRRYKGEELASIPKYADLPIRPDLIALAVVNKNKSKTFGWIIGECKVSALSVGDIRQAVYYAGIAEAYGGYLFYEGQMTREVKALIQSGGLLYSGTNKWGKPVRKRLVIKIYENCRFSKTIG